MAASQVGCILLHPPASYTKNEKQAQKDMPKDNAQHTTPISHITVHTTNSPIRPPSPSPSPLFYPNRVFGILSVFSSVSASRESPARLQIDAPCPPIICFTETTDAPLEELSSLLVVAFFKSSSSFTGFVGVRVKFGSLWGTGA